MSKDACWLIKVLEETIWKNGMFLDGDKCQGDDKDEPVKRWPFWENILLDAVQIFGFFKMSDSNCKWHEHTVKLALKGSSFEISTFLAHKMMNYLITRSLDHRLVRKVIFLITVSRETPPSLRGGPGGSRYSPRQKGGGPPVSGGPYLQRPQGTPGGPVLMASKSVLATWCEKGVLRRPCC